MSVLPKAAGFVQHWPSIAIVVALGLVAKEYVLSEPIRGVMSIACIALAVYQWAIYRRRQRYSLVGFVLVMLTMVSIWLALNVIRSYTYPTHAPWRMLALYGVVVRAQGLLIWPILGGVFVVIIWTTLRLAHWLAARIS